jgi:beta-lactamase class A
VATAEKSFKGRLGVGVLDVQTGEDWYLNGDKHFRMQSVVKVPVAIAVLRKVDEGKMQLNQEIPLTPADVSLIRNAAIPDPISPKAKSATLSSLIERSIRRSNNGAVDVMTRILGGPAAINVVLKDAQISGIRVDRYESEVTKFDDHNQGAALMDSATPRAACALLYKLETGKLLSQKSTSYLLDLMSRCETGDHRIRAGFPKDWTIADKTGTGRQASGINVATNDVAIVTGPDKSCWILTVFVADAKLTRPACEDKIAEVARALYDSTR